MSQNNNLHTAKKQKQDEFYTLYEDIEKELQHYPEQLKDKIIYCNCDDYENSNFYKYFKDNFNKLQLKEVIATGYDITTKEGKYAKYNGSVEYTNNNFNGDFKANTDLLKYADIIITNPPFSLFREYFKLLVEYNKKFLILGNSNAITFKEFFPLIKNGKVWLGRTLFTGKMPFFRVLNTYDFTNDRYVKIGNEYYKQVNGIAWFTNLPNDNKNNVTLHKYYTDNDYPKYDNYDAIEVSKVAEIPFNYNGVIGVPITILKYLHSDGYIYLNVKNNMKQVKFEIIELGNSRENFTPNKDYINPKKVLKDGKIVSGGAINCVLTLSTKTKPINQIYYISDNSDYLIPPYARILIRRK